MSCGTTLHRQRVLSSDPDYICADISITGDKRIWTTGPPPWKWLLHLCLCGLMPVRSNMPHLEA